MYSLLTIADVDRGTLIGITAGVVVGVLALVVLLITAMVIVLKNRKGSRGRFHKVCVCVHHVCFILTSKTRHVQWLKWDFQPQCHGCLCHDVALGVAYRKVSSASV